MKKQGVEFARQEHWERLVRHRPCYAAVFNFDQFRINKEPVNTLADLSQRRRPRLSPRGFLRVLPFFTPTLSNTNPNAH